MSDLMKRLSPPGLDLTPEWRTFLIGNIGSVLISLFAFCDRYLDARRRLYTYVNEERVLIDGATMAPFFSLLSEHFLLFLLVALLLLGYVIYHYAYYRQGSMSLYLMRRLPNRWERHKRALTLPCLAALATLVIAAAAIQLDFIIYIIATPKACLPYPALREIWR